MRAVRRRHVSIRHDLWSCGKLCLMEVDDLVRYYPRLYHMAEDGAWDSIRRQGLMSTASLVELFEIPEPQRSQLLTQHRPESVALTHPILGTVVIRDQKPLQVTKLEQLLTDMTVPEWIELLNSFVFFWRNYSAPISAAVSELTV
jgi:hypothetical protein